MDKPTLKTPTELGKKYDKSALSLQTFIDEVDSNLNDDSFKTKRKIFKLAKMEDLVRNDEFLFNKYNDLKTNARDKFGYHWNEVVMNLMFNDYVLNDKNYLAKYYKAREKEKTKRGDIGNTTFKDPSGNGDKKPEPAKEITPDPEPVQETTSTGSVGAGASMGSGGYSQPAIWAKDKSNWVNYRRPMYVGGKVIEEGYIQRIIQEEVFELKKDAKKIVSQIDSFVKEMGGWDKLDPKTQKELKDRYENAKKNIGEQAIDDWYLLDDNGKISKSFKDGEVPEEFGNKVIHYNEMTIDPSLEENYSSNINEDHLSTKEERVAFIIQNKPDAYNIEKLDAMDDNQINDIYLNIEKEMGNSNNSQVNEKAVSQAQQKFMGLVNAVKKGEINPDDVSKDVVKTSKEMSDKDVKDFASTKHDGLPEKIKEAGEGSGVEYCTLFFAHDSDADEYFDILDQKGEEGLMDYIASAIDTNDCGDIRKELGAGSNDKIYKHGDLILVYNTQLGYLGLDRIYNSTNESIVDDQEDSMVNKSSDSMVTEDKKTPSIINRDRIGKENEANFKSEFKKSNTEKIVNDAKIGENGYEEIGDPKKLSQDLEKASLTKSLDNNGNATRDQDAIPKRNLTSDEENELMLNRGGGMEDWKYDNEPSERFEERMKQDMAEKYPEKNKKEDFHDKKPSYMKDKQPIANNQFNESINAYYFNNLGKRVVTIVKLDKIYEADNTQLNKLFKLHTDGMGNNYNGFDFTVNEDFKNFVNNNDLYMNESGDVFVSKKAEVIKENSNFSKMFELMDYKPSDYIKHNKPIE